ncbi:putative DNA helicase [Mycoplasmopsis maculosa]|uniref:Putative DNA helicase n=1 Tax=Mycoplasmopsis maculosa TaxID=114885 RepID=A0A449B5F5_9BACT|nr:DEAD/DEAH box helicase [Mycoplasmopsis maculosa]VEU75806.1 putative DNA helicase [Mycoplasmopsis maculosa]
MNEKIKEYQSILDNLLDVSPGDTTIFTKVNNKYSFDFYRQFGENSFEKVFNSANFNIPILEVNLLKIAEDIKNSLTPEEVELICENNDIILSPNKINNLRKDFESTKIDILDKIKSNFQKQSLKWKLFLNKADEINTESNIWPMHLGFIFIKVSIDNKSIYAPLFLKEVYLEIKNARPHLISNGDIKINEKLLFLLNNAGFDLKLNDNISDWSIKQVMTYLNTIWENIYDFNLDIKSSFINLIPEEITNNKIEFYPGLVLGLFQPSGGYVRNRMMEIIKNDELKKIFKVEFNKNKYKERVNEVIFNPKTSIFKITPTNFSQDKAIVSSLNQNTIIWGPPGTGKSQTIVNLLTNILVFEKTALVCSQKKAALEVIRNRMNSLKQFCLFMLNDKNMNKKAFYEPIKEYLTYLENYNENPSLKGQKILSDDELKFINKINSFYIDSRFNKATKLLPSLVINNEFISEELFNSILKLESNITFFENMNFLTKKAMKKHVLKLNNVIYKPFNKTNKKIKKIINKNYEWLNNFEGNLNKILTNIKSFKNDDYTYIKGILELLIKNESTTITDESMLKSYISRNIISKINNFTEDQKEIYTEFAATVRLANLSPYKFIKKFSEMIKILFPIIIVTPDVDLSVWKKEELDYAILDESSQIFIEKGLPVLYLAKKKILAGDDKQMKPSNWFGIRVSDNESIYGNVESLLDYAQSLAVYNILLDKNYRSNYASLMTFSSKHFYNETLDVIDSPNDNINFKPIEVIEANGLWENNKNETEAAIVIDQLNKNFDLFNKIILLCFNAKQQDYLTTIIFKAYPKFEKAILEGKLLLRNIENIQGDEADLVIASVAYDSSTSIHSTYVGRPGGKNALNVAISRAKDKMIVVKSIKSSDIYTETNEELKIFKKWLEFLELPESEQKVYSKNKTILNKEKNESSLFDEIKETIDSLIVNKPYLKLKINESIGTLSVDFVLYVNKKPEIVIMIDNYEYSENIGKYLEQKDIYKFIRSKNYKAYLLDKIKWEFIKENLIKTISNFEEEFNDYFEEYEHTENDNKIKLENMRRTLAISNYESSEFDEDTIELDKETNIMNLIEIKE